MTDILYVLFCVTEIKDLPRFDDGDLGGVKFEKPYVV